MTKLGSYVTGMGLVLLLSACQLGGNRSGLFSTRPAFPFSSSSISPAQSVQDALLSSGDPVLAQVKVQDQGKVVILSGYVKKIRQSDTAEQLAGQLVGIQNVQNRIIVRQ